MKDIQKSILRLERNLKKWIYLCATEGKEGKFPSRQSCKLFLLHLTKIDMEAERRLIDSILSRVYPEPIQMQFEFMEQNDEKRLQK